MADATPNLPDPDLVYRNYLETCRRMGCRGCAARSCALMGKWFDTLGRDMTTPKPTKHYPKATQAR